ncbi:hypothetical protein [Citricoccus sp. GCM10030269]|uniref:hypothetical protein n=1 Tax=Citricoccus sp. GCM10030269 TaxID=3273388 RepID=UPI003623FC33
MPRSNRPRRRRGPPRGTGPVWDPGYRQEDGHDGGWHVRQIPAWRAVKDYVCPGCGRTIPPGLPHLVAWRSDLIFGDDAAAADRRHWHPKCWSTRQQDGPY